MSLKFFDKLSKDFTDILNDKECYDVTIEVGNAGDKKLFTSHSTILRFRSSYFREELTKAIIDKNPITIIKLDISAEFIEVILRYVYGGIVNLEDKDNKFIFGLMIIANDFKFKELSQQLEIYLIENKASWLRTHFSLVYHSIFKSRNFERLEKFCNDIIVKYPNLIFDTEDFTSLDETALVSLLKREDLQMDEIEIWKKIIQWGVAKHKLLSRLEEWTKEDFQALKLTLQHCLPYIRYSQFSQAVLWRHIKPYKKLLDKQLWDDINKRLILPDEPITSVILPARLKIAPDLPERTVEPFSTIISYDHAAEISSWVDRKITTYSSKDIPYKFQLILRGSRDGFNPLTFWDMCHGCANTVTILKVSGTDEILGGYNPLAWDKTVHEGWVTTNNSFIFSLKNGNIQNSILSRIKNTKCAVRNILPFYQNKYGMDFGDLSMFSQKSDFTQDCLCYAGSAGCYEKRIRLANGFFSIVDYEVFRLVKLENH